MSCSFLNLPAEIRLSIYDELFSSTTLAFRDSKGRVKPISQPSPLSILYTCKTVYLEAEGRWQDKVLYHFDGPETMLEVLARKTQELTSDLYACAVMPAVKTPLLVTA